MKRLAIFAGYDKDNIIDDYVVYYIKELKKIADIIYVSDCNMPDKELNKITSYCIHIINGRHEEYDFGSYKRGYLYAKENNILKNYDYLIFCNDSCYGPFFNFQEIIKNMESKNTDAWSIFNCYKDKYNNDHLQSYFLSLKQTIFISEYFYNFISSVTKEKTKYDIILKYEIGLTNLLKKHNLKISSFLDSSIKDKEEDNNNVPFFNVTKAIKYGFPFFKIIIFKESIALKLNIHDLKTIFNLIENTYDINLIVKHLNRIIEDKDSIKYLFPRFNILNINNKILNIQSQYSNSNKYRIIFRLFNIINLTIDLPTKLSYIDHKYKDFNFLLKGFD